MDVRTPCEAVASANPGKTRPPLSAPLHAPPRAPSHCNSRRGAGPLAMYRIHSKHRALPAPRAPPLLCPLFCFTSSFCSSPPPFLILLPASWQQARELEMHYGSRTATAAGVAAAGAAAAAAAVWDDSISKQTRGRAWQSGRTATGWLIPSPPPCVAPPLSHLYTPTASIHPTTTLPCAVPLSPLWRCRSILLHGARAPRAAPRAVSLLPYDACALAPGQTFVAQPSVSLCSCGATRIRGPARLAQREVSLGTTPPRRLDSDGLGTERGPTRGQAHLLLLRSRGR